VDDLQERARMTNRQETGPGALPATGPLRRRRRAVTGAALALVAAAAGGPARSQAWPSRPIRVVVGFPAGGVVDVMARAVTDRVSIELGQPIVVDNRPGAGSNIAGSAVATAAPDGYTWLVTSNFLFINPVLDATTRWKAEDFAPVARYALSPSFVMVPASTPHTTLAAFVDHARQHPGLQYGDGGPGTTQALSLQMLVRKAGIRLEPVMYKGAPPMIPDLASGQLALVVLPSTVAIAAMQTGRIRALATTGDRRSPALPDVPTLAESGYPEASALSWYGLHVPAGTPEAVVQRIARAVEAACATPEVRQRLVAAGGEEAFQASAPFSAFIAAEARRWLGLLKGPSGG
jgi:tripartite-type tricarboxylate transporter receptor subunit TctC